MQHKNIRNPKLSDFEKIHELICGRAYASAIYVAAKLGIADLLIEKPKTAEELAREIDVNEECLYRLMRALSSIGIFREDVKKKFKMTPLGSTLRSDIPNSIRDLAIMCGSDWHWQTWGGLLYTIKTGKPYFKKHFGKEFFSYIKENVQSAEEFNDAMSSLSSLNNYAIVDKYDFSDAKLIIDVGGGHGSLLREILNFNKNAHGILYDLPSVAQIATEIFKNDEINQRIKIKSGDFFNFIPSGGDVYILKHVLHGLDNVQSSKILKKISNSMPEYGKLLIIEMIIPEKNKRSYSKFNDLGMILLSGMGKERKQEEFEKIISDAELIIKNIFSANFGVFIIETIKK